jgi:hypothetical protein
MIHSEYVNLILKYDGYIKSKWKLTDTVHLFGSKDNA